MTSIRHSDTVALARRRELVANELRLIDAELERRADKAMQDQNHGPEPTQPPKD